MFTIFVIIVLAALAYQHSLLWALGFIPLLLIFYVRWNNYHREPWRRDHNDLMRVHAMLAGFERGASEKDGREFNLIKVLMGMIEAALPHGSAEEKTRLLTRQMVNSRFPNKEIIARHINPKTEEDLAVVSEVLKVVDQIAASDDNGWKVRALIAELIEEKYGIDAKAAYLVAVFTNGVK